MATLAGGQIRNGECCRWPSAGPLERAGLLAVSSCADFWKQHPDLAAILQIALTEMRNEIALFEPDADEDVARRHDGEEQVTNAHLWRRPQREDEAEIERMAVLRRLLQLLAVSGSIICGTSVMRVMGIPLSSA